MVSRPAAASAVSSVAAEYHDGLPVLRLEPELTPCTQNALCPEGQRLLAAETGAGEAWVRLIGWPVRSDSDAAKRTLSEARARLREHTATCGQVRDEEAEFERLAIQSEGM